MELGKTNRESHYLTFLLKNWFLLAAIIDRPTSPRYFIKGQVGLIDFFLSNQNTLYVMHLFYSDNEIKTVCGRPAICTLIGWFKSSRLYTSLSVSVGQRSTLCFLKTHKNSLCIPTVKVLVHLMNLKGYLRCCNQKI